MEPNKKIPSFCFESPWLKPFDLNMESVEVQGATRRMRVTWTPELAQDVSVFNNIDAEAELTALLSEQVAAEIDREILRDLVLVQPMNVPQGNLFYFDYNYGPMEEPMVYDDGSWSMGNTFDGVIGIKSEIKPHTLI
tara:strand:- start:210 stop:620 length:411 start_codon:yes stop_codon:yes gene_type:complete